MWREKQWHQAQGDGENPPKRSAHAGPKSEQMGHFRQCKGMTVTVRL